MKKSIDLKSLKNKVKKLTKVGSRHSAFALILIVLFIYLFDVWRISRLVTAEPTTEAQDQAQLTAKIPKVDKSAINKIQSLEKNSPDVKSLFNSARKNPFSE